MLENPHLTKTVPQRTAVIRLTIPRAEIRNAMGPAIGEVIAAVQAQGMKPAGPVFARHFRMDPGMFDFEVGVPVPGPFTKTGRVGPGELPAEMVARVTYRGPYEGLHSAWGEFNKWVAAEGHTAAPHLWESYVAGPESSPDPSSWKTELNRPLVA